MQRTLLKLFAFTLLEKTCRFERILDERGHDKDQLPPSLIADLRAQMARIQQTVLETPDLFDTLFNPKAKSTIALQQFLSDVFYPQYHALCDASRWLNQWGLNRQPEMGMFLKDAISPEELATFGYRVVELCDQASSTQPRRSALDTPDNTPNSAMLEKLSVLDILNPLGWATLSFQYALKLAQSDEAKGLRQWTRIENALGKTDADKAYQYDLLAHAIGLRLHGPAYYFNAVINGLLTQDPLSLSHIEPLLFHGLGHNGGLDKQALLIHEGLDNHKAVLMDMWAAHAHAAGETLDEPSTEMDADTLGAFFSMAEKLIPERDAFTERHVERVLALQDALHEHTLISAKAVYPHQAAYAQWSESDEDTSVYTNLNLVTHVPNSPREIVNAGWMYHLERLPIWLYDTMATDTGNADSLRGMDSLRHRLARQDFLLTKSIETSEVHRVLLTPAEPAMV